MNVFQTMANQSMKKRAQDFVTQNPQVSAYKNIQTGGNTIGNIARGVTNVVAKASKYVPMFAPAVKQYNTVQKYQPQTQQPKLWRNTNEGKAAMSQATANVQMRQQPSAPSPQPQPMGTPPSAPSQPSQNTTMNQLFSRQQDYINSAEARQRALQEQMRQENERNAEQRFGNVEADLRAQIPELQGQFERFRGNVQAGIQDTEKQGEQQKQQADTYYGDLQRQLMQNKRQTDAQREKQYAGLGTIDSYGTGSFTQGNANADTEFTRMTNQNLEAKASKLSDIDMAVGQAKRDAQAKIDDEGAKLQSTLRQIESMLRDNSQAKGEAMRGAYLQYQQAIGDIQDQYEGLRMAGEEAKMQYQLELNKAQPDLSEEFMQTGVPQTMNDFIYRTQNASAFGKFGESGKAKTSAQLQMEGKAGAGLRALDTIETEILKNPNILVQNSIWGAPGTREFEGAVSSAMDAIGGLRTGASVSKEQQAYYRNMLPKAGDSQETIKNKLMALRQELQGYAQDAQNMRSGTDELMQILGL
jgi:hypothetical protein